MEQEWYIYELKRLSIENRLLRRALLNVKHSSSIPSDVKQICDLLSNTSTDGLLCKLGGELESRGLSPQDSTDDFIKLGMNLQRSLDKEHVFLD
ncbi:MAG: hypothetical protein CL916_10595 [Deltaproteobacteria bacterium]|nr:hypothetical protein [Deltaproteobacteria bacterium]